MINSAVIIGSGNVATHLSVALKNAGVHIACVCSPNKTHAAALAEKLGTNFVCNVHDINCDADIFIFSVKDSILQSVINETRPSRSIWVHTSGSMAMDLFKGKTDRYGVIYPLQTFSKECNIDFRNVPLFIEGNDTETLQEVRKLAIRLSENINEASSQQRKALHLSAVFACNFVNHLYDIASETLKTSNLPFSVLLPLIEETAHKVKAMSPRKAQTGPAVRYDTNVISSHLALIENESIKNIYSLLSENIHKLNADK
ncbi:MAG: DUF2520 domain-containing protein [Bacteroidales bacterium]